MEIAKSSPRYVIIDIARFYAISLVFYGHFIEEFMLLKNAVGASQYRFIYSFHMVLFIVLAGYVAKERDVDMRVGAFMEHRFFSRLLPFIFFTAVMIVPTLFFDGKFYGLVLPSTDGYMQGLLSTVFGIPLFCVPSWFLLLIIGVELVHYCVFRFIRESEIRILMAILVFYVVGYWLNLKLDIFNPMKGRTIGWNYFFIHEALFLYSFYLVGLYLRRKQIFTRSIPAQLALPAAALAFLIVLFTYSLNNGPFNFNAYNAVIILFSSHGDFWLFPFTTLAGCACIACISTATRPGKLLVWLGQNTLILMCLNGVFYHYTNPPMAKWVLDSFGDSALTVSIAGVLTTVISLILCIPFVYLFNRYVPQLVGKPKINGPLLRKFIS